MLIGVLAVGCESQKETPVEVDAKDAASRIDASEERVEKLSVWPGTDANQALERTEAAIAFHQKRAKADSESWLDLETVAANHMSRARIAGSYDEYARAEEALKLAASRSEGGIGLTYASFNFALHRFDEVEPHLKRVEAGAIVDDDKHSQIAATRGDLALSRGEFAAAEEFYTTAIDLIPSSGNKVRMAHLERYRGNLDKAESWMDSAIEASLKESKFQAAWTLLQRGILELERGRYDRAMEFYEKADARFSGWYLIIEHIAEIHAIREDWDEAEGLYRDILKYVPSPEFMDALAEVLESQGKPEQAAEWTQKAKAAYEEQLKSFPNSAYGHALDHFLTNDPARAVELAEKNRKVRPGPQSTIAYAQALVAADQHDKGRDVLKSVETSDWSTADYHAIAYGLAKGVDDESARLHRERATKLNPDILSEFDWISE